MLIYSLPLEVRWSDLDPNFHLRHSVYYDYGAYCRVSFLEKEGLTSAVMHELHIGPVLFREEAVFRKEIRMGDKPVIDLQLTKTKSDFSRWSIRHRIIKQGDVLAATLHVDAAWIDTRARKLASPPPQVKDIFSKIPRSDDFEWVI